MSLNLRKNLEIIESIKMAPKQSKSYPSQLMYFLSEKILLFDSVALFDSDDIFRMSANFYLFIMAIIYEKLFYFISKVTSI